MLMLVHFQHYLVKNAFVPYFFPRSAQQVLESVRRGEAEEADEDFTVPEPATGPGVERVWLKVILSVFVIG